MYVHDYEVYLRKYNNCCRQFQTPLKIAAKLATRFQADIKFTPCSICLYYNKKINRQGHSSLGLPRCLPHRTLWTDQTQWRQIRPACCYRMRRFWFSRQSPDNAGRLWWHSSHSVARIFPIRDCCTVYLMIYKFLWITVNSLFYVSTFSILSIELLENRNAKFSSQFNKVHMSQK